MRSRRWVEFENPIAVGTAQPLAWNAPVESTEIMHPVSSMKVLIPLKPVLCRPGAFPVTNSYAPDVVETVICPAPQASTSFAVPGADTGVLQPATAAPATRP